VVELAHFHFTVVVVDFQAFHGRRDLDRIGGLGLGHGGAQHVEGRRNGAGEHVVLVLGLEVGHPLAHLAAHVVVRVGHLEHAAGAALAQRRRRAGHTGVVGEELAVVAAFVGGLDQQRQVGTPVASDHGVGARGLDLGDVGREIAHLCQWVQVFTHDLHVGALAGQVFLGELGHLVTVRVVLVEQVDVLDVRLVLHEGGHGLHLHRGIGVEAEVPVAALAVGEVRVHGGVVQEDHFLARVALVVLVDGVDQRAGHRRPVALRDVAHTLVQRGLEGVETFRRAELVVEGDQLELHTGRVALAELLGKELPAAHLVEPERAHQAGLRVDQGDLDRFTLLGEGRAQAQRQGGDGDRFQDQFHCMSPVRVWKASAYRGVRPFGSGIAPRPYRARDWRSHKRSTDGQENPQTRGMVQRAGGAIWPGSNHCTGTKPKPVPSASGSRRWPTRSQRETHTRVSSW